MPFLIANWRIVAVLVLVAALGGYGLAMRLQRDEARTEFATFKEQVAEAAQRQTEEALKRTIADEKRKDEADAEHEKTVSTLNARIASLRAQRASVVFLPPAASCPERPASACLNRDLLERALRDLDAGVQGLVDEGSRATVDLDTAKKWAQGR